MNEIVFATNNPNKIKEVAEMLKGLYSVKSLEDIGCKEELEETHDSLAGNADQKSSYVALHYQVDCFADDTGLEIDSLNGEPGVYSARYGGPQRKAEDNMDLVLEKLKNKKDRSAQFRTIISLQLGGKTHHFEGKVRGKIREEKSGVEGFGYDPIFEPEGYDRTFAELSAEEKNAISHRGIAVRKLIDFLKKNQN